MALDWSGPIPDFVELKTQWRSALQDGRAALEILPPQQVGTAVLQRDGTPFLGDVASLQSALETDELLFHAGHIGGAWPVIGVEHG